MTSNSGGPGVGPDEVVERFEQVLDDRRFRVAPHGVLARVAEGEHRVRDLVRGEDGEHVRLVLVLVDGPQQPPVAHPRVVRRRGGRLRRGGVQRRGQGAHRKVAEKVSDRHRLAERHAGAFAHGLLVPAFAIGLCAEQMASRVRQRHCGTLAAAHPLLPLLTRVLGDYLESEGLAKREKKPEHPERRKSDHMKAAKNVVSLFMPLIRKYRHGEKTK